MEKFTYNTHLLVRQTNNSRTWAVGGMEEACWTPRQDAPEGLDLPEVRNTSFDPMEAMCLGR